MGEADDNSTDGHDSKAPVDSPQEQRSSTTRLLGETAVEDTFDQLYEKAHADTWDALLEKPESSDDVPATPRRSPSEELPTQEYTRITLRRGGRQPGPEAAVSPPGVGPGPATEPTAAPLADERISDWDLATPMEGEESHIIGSRYRITEGIGIGGMGAIFKVRHLELGKIFALKIILSELSGDPRAQRFFFREAQALSQLSHPNIVQVTDFGTDEVFGAYLVMEYLKGETLFDLLDRKGQLSPTESLIIAIQLARALEHMHSRELTHCDIKPENVFLIGDPGGRPRIKLIDFGLSRHVAQGAKLVASEVAATPVYAAPEQLAGMAPAPSMDIYGIGAVLYEMVTGTTPFDGSVQEILEQKERGPVEPPSERMDAPLAPQVEALILSAMEHDPQKRYPTMEALINGLRGALEVYGEPSRTTLPGIGRQSQDSEDELGLGETSVLTTGVVDARAFCQTFPLPLVLLDPDGIIMAASPHFCRMMKQLPSALQGTPLSKTRLGALDPDIDLELVQAKEHRQQILRRFDYTTPDGDSSAIAVWFAPHYDHAGRLDGFWGIVMPALDREESP